jgi:hypothetical protein
MAKAYRLSQNGDVGAKRLKSPALSGFIAQRPVD